MSITTKSLKQQIIYRSSKRGCRESEMILRKFVATNIDSINNNMLVLLAELLTNDDLYILRWITNKEIPPNKFAMLIEKIKNTI